jgi:4-hydroxybenzoate polyprenyltransferase
MLAVSILVYDAIHKIFAFSPILMAGCRFFLVILAASAAEDGVVGLSIWSALVLAAYVVGLSFLARRESTHVVVQPWPSFFLAAPVVLALVINRGEFARRGLLLSVILGIWALASLRHIFWAAQPNIGRTVSGLLAGIVLVDLLAVGGGPLALRLVFASLFVLALLFQRFIPAT